MNLISRPGELGQFHGQAWPCSANVMGSAPAVAEEERPGLQKNEYFLAAGGGIGLDPHRLPRLEHPRQQIGQLREHGTENLKIERPGMITNLMITTPPDTSDLSHHGKWPQIRELTRLLVRSDRALAGGGVFNAEPLDPRRARARSCRTPRQRPSSGEPAWL